MEPPSPGQVPDWAAASVPLTPTPASEAGLAPTEVLSGAAEQSSFLRGSAHIWEWSPHSLSWPLTQPTLFLPHTQIGASRDELPSFLVAAR